MSATRSNALAGSGRAVLRWSESPNSPSREEPVDILQSRPSETLIRSALFINEKTRVYLIKKGYTRIGFVKSCWEDHGIFLLEIATATGSLSLVSGHPADPGVIVVDDFITEEQETQILNDLDAGEETVPRCALPVKLNQRQPWQFVLDLQRRLLGISNASPAPRLAGPPALPAY
jgi:hypothetical protein